MTLSRLPLKPLDKTDVSKVRKNQGLQKVQGRVKYPRSWEKTQEVVTLEAFLPVWQ